MAIRRPSIFKRNEIVIQDFQSHISNFEEFRFMLAKWDGEPFETVNQTFDYPFPELKGGPVISRVDYTVSGNLITIDHWETNWKDEWPLRLSIQYLVHCLYPESSGYSVRVKGEPREFWVSEKFEPITNSPDDFLMFNHGNS